jgi:ABC-type glycerol-3-phosphate transport system substrate-binding protein
MKKIALVLMSLFLVSGMLWSAGQKQGATKEKVTLKLWVAGTEPIWKDYHYESFKRYKAIKPNVEFEYAEAPFGNEIETKLNVAFASGTSPDLIGHGIISIAERAEKGHYEPLDSYFEKYKDKDDIIPSLINEFPEYKGKRYGVIFYPVPEPFVYRKDFYEEVGLDPSKPPTTWEELADHAVKLTKIEGGTTVRSGLSIPYDGFKLMTVLGRQNEAKIKDKEGNPSFDNKEMVETLEFVTDLWNKKVSMETTTKQERTLGLFFVGKSAMSWSLPSIIKKAIMDDASFKDKIGFMNFKRKKGGVWCGAAFLFMSSESKNKEEAWDFMQFYWDKDETWERYKATASPVVRKSLQDQYMKDDPYLNDPLWSAVAVGIGAPKVPWSVLYLFKYLPQAQQEAFYGKKTPAQALKDAVVDMRKELKLTK